MLFWTLQTILFTTDEAILEAVSKHDDAFEGETFSDADDEMPVQRPSTADADDDVSSSLINSSLFCTDIVIVNISKENACL